MTFTELSEYLKLVGIMLQHVLSRARYAEVSGISNLTSATANVIPDLFEMLLLDKRFARMLSVGEALPDEYHKKLVEGRLYLQSVDLENEIYLSLLDIELHTKYGCCCFAS